MKAVFRIIAVNLVASLLLVSRTSGVDFRVYGSIIDGGTTQPLTNVEVQLLYSPLSQTEDDEPLLLSTNTNANGEFDFGSLTNEIEGEVRVLQLLSGYVAPLVEQVGLSSLSPTKQVTLLAGTAATLTGSVVITSGTAALTNFTIEVNATEVKAAANGAFVIPELPASQQTARVIYQDGYYFDERVISLPSMTAGQTNTMLIYWNQPIHNLTTSGVLRDSNGNVLGGARIRFLGMNTGVFVGMKTDANGNYAIYDLPDDCYAVRAFVGRWGVEQRTLSAADSILCVGNGGGDIGDGIPDGWRIHYFGSSTTNSDSCASCDSDGDGLSNIQEYQRGTNPTNSLAVNITLYANSVIGSNSFDGITPVVMGGHGPKLTIQGAISTAVSNDTVQIAGDQAGYADSTLSPGAKSLTLRPTGSVTILP